MQCFNKLFQVLAKFISKTFENVKVSENATFKQFVQNSLLIYFFEKRL